MKKILIFAIGLFLSMGTVVAQVKVNRGYGNPSSEAARKSSTKSHGAALAVKYGVKAGVNFSNMSNDMTFDPSFSHRNRVSCGRTYEPPLGTKDCQ